jgi:hypothetical protein
MKETMMITAPRMLTASTTTMAKDEVIHKADSIPQ